jgi:hypothetical protein
MDDNWLAEDTVETPAIVKEKTPFRLWLEELGITKFPAGAQSRIRSYLGGTDICENEFDILKGLVKDGWTEIEAMAAKSKAGGHPGTLFDALFPSAVKKKDGTPCNWPIVRWAALAKQQAENGNQQAQQAEIRSAIARMTPEQIIKHIPYLDRLKNSFEPNSPDRIKADNDKANFDMAFNAELKRRLHPLDREWILDFHRRGCSAGGNFRDWFAHKLYAIGEARLLSKERRAEFEASETYRTGRA